MSVTKFLSLYNSVVECIDDFKLKLSLSQAHKVQFADITVDISHDMNTLTKYIRNFMTS